MKEGEFWEVYEIASQLQYRFLTSMNFMHDKTHGNNEITHFLYLRIHTCESLVNLLISNILEYSIHEPNEEDSRKNRPIFAKNGKVQN